MIQRKQSLWLLIAALLNSGVLFFDMYKWHETVNGVDSVRSLKVLNHYPTLILALVITLLPLVAIFMYRQRKRQIGMAIMSMVSVGSFITLMLSRVSNLSKQAIPVSDPTYAFGSMLPIISLLFLILAIVGIRKDEKLVKSMDRLR